MRIFIVSLLVVCCTFGQGNTGSILGTVTDPSGAVVPGVRVSITNVDTSSQAAALTDGLGNYLAQFLAPGSYRIEAEVPGFRKFVRENISLDMTRQLRIDIALETGAVSETVSVVGSTPLIETETGTLSTTIENMQVVRLPLINRNPQDFRLLVPGVVQNRDGFTVPQGGLVRKDPYFIDGAHSTLHVWVGTPANPNPDVIQEFKVLTTASQPNTGKPAARSWPRRPNPAPTNSMEACSSSCETTS